MECSSRFSPLLFADIEQYYHAFPYERLSLYCAQASFNIRQASLQFSPTFPSLSHSCQAPGRADAASPPPFPRPTGSLRAKAAAGAVHQGRRQHQQGALRVPPSPFPPFSPHFPPTPPRLRPRAPAPLPLRPAGDGDRPRRAAALPHPRVDGAGERGVGGCVQFAGLGAGQAGQRPQERRAAARQGAQREGPRTHSAPHLQPPPPPAHAFALTLCPAPAPQPPPSFSSSFRRPSSRACAGSRATPSESSRRSS